MTGVFANQSEFHQGPYQPRYNAQTVSATFTSTHSPAQYFARQPPVVLFTVPEGYRLARSTTIEDEGSPVTPDGSPHPTSTAARRFRLRVAPDGTVRYVNDTGAEDLAYTARATWSTDLLAADRAALVAFCKSTQGDNWAVNFNWGRGDVPLKECYGLSTNAAGRVTHLDLTTSGLKGTLPPEIVDFTALVKLKLTLNQQSCMIPPTLGQLHNLTCLDLAGNKLSGAIPPELGGLRYLEKLSLQENQLSGPIPHELGQLRNLERLSLSRNQLSGEIPRGLGQLHSLEALAFYETQVSDGVPRELGQLRNLKNLWINDKRLSGNIPREPDQLKKLRILFLGGNDWTGCFPARWFDTRNNYIINGDSKDLGLPPC